MRPKAIVLFEQLGLLSIFVSTLQLTGLLDARSGEAGSLAELGLTLGFALLSAALVLFASRRRSRVALWVLTGLTALGVVAAAYPAGMAAGADRIDPAQVVDLLAVALQAAAVIMAWTRPARAWFAEQDVAAE